MITQKQLRKKKNAELSKLDRKLEKLERQMLSPKQQSFIQFINYKAIQKRLGIKGYQ